MTKIITGTTVDDRYEITDTIGHGGFGTVFKAWQKQFDRPVALKLLNTGVLEESDGMPRFEREAKALSALKHKNIVSFYGYGVWDRAPYMVMEFIEGTSLQSAMRAEGAFEPMRATRIMKQVCEALACAHANGVVHRDLKPSNVMLVHGPDDREVVKIIDFGLVKLMPGYGLPSQKLTEVGCAIGTCHYMSPEQCVGGEIDNRSDLYAAGCILYQMITGKMPFDADDTVAVMYMQLQTLPPPLSEQVATTPLIDALQAVISRSMAKDVNDRYQSANDMVADLDSIVRGESGKLAQIGRTSQKLYLPKTAAQQVKSNLKWLIVGGVAVITTTAILLQMPPPQEEPDTAGDATSTGMYDDMTRSLRTRKRSAADLLPQLERIVAQNDKDAKLDPMRLSEMYRRLSESYLILDENQKALDAIKKAYEIYDPRVRVIDDGWRWELAYASALDRAGDYKAAKAMLEEFMAKRAEKNYPRHSHSAAVLVLSRVYNHMGAYDQSEKMLTKEYESEHSNEELRHDLRDQLAETKVFIGHLAGAHDLYAEMLTEGKKGKAYLGLVRCALRQNHTEEAATYLDRLMRSAKKSGHIDYNLYILQLGIAIADENKQEVNRILTEMKNDKNLVFHRDHGCMADENHVLCPMLEDHPDFAYVHDAVYALIH